MRVYRSNSLEELTSCLAENLRVPRRPENLLRPEVILIQSPGIQRYLSRELSKRLGVLAGAEFPYPRSFFERLFDEVLGDAEKAKRFSRETLAFVLFGIFGRVLGGDSLGAPNGTWANLALFLERDRDGTDRFLLAERYANLFDQYVTYRPKMVLGWGEGTDPGDEQAELFRAVLRELGPHHLAVRAKALLDSNRSDALLEALPERVSLVGGPGLPPIFLTLLRHLGESTRVDVYSFAVSREFIGDAGRSDEDSELGAGIHPLITSLGRVGADYQDLLETIADYEDGKAEYRAPLGKSVLAALKQDLLEARVRPESEKLDASYRRCESIVLDVAHSELREVEILEQKLLGYFADDPTLLPEEVVVLTPKIARYAPFVRSVFGDAREEEIRIPYRIADQSERAENPYVTVFLRALRLLSGRFRASEFVYLLSSEEVYEHLELDAERVERISDLLERAGAHFGFDEEHLASYGLPPDPIGTLSWAFSRLLLGIAMGDDGDSAFRGIVPFGGVESSDRQPLDTALRFLDRLGEQRKRLRLETGTGRGTTGELASALRALYTELFGDGGSDGAPLLAAIKRVEERASFAQVAEPLPLSLFVRVLEKELEASRQSTDFLAGGVTFCELLPLRTIPFRVVCALGLGQSEFPRADRLELESKMLERPQRGDRSLREEDKYLFLELLMAAGEKLSLSYVGRSIQDNTEKPPSVLVVELAQVLEGMFVERSETPYLRGRTHPLQPFSPKNFRGPFANFRTAYFDAAKAYLGRADEKKPFLPKDFAFPKPLEKEFSLGDIVAFFAKPSRAWLRKLRVVVRDEIEVIEDRAPGVLGPLGAYKVADAILERRREGKDSGAEILRLRGAVSPGAIGKLELASAMTRTERIVEYLEERNAVETRLAEPLVVVLPSGERIFGMLSIDASGYRHLPTVGKGNGKRQLRAWLEHVFVCATGIPFEGTVLVARAEADEEIELGILRPLPVEKARELLGVFLELYRELSSEPRYFSADVLFGIEKLLAEGKEPDFSTLRRLVDPNFLSEPGARTGAPERGSDEKQLFGRSEELSDEELTNHPLLRITDLLFSDRRNFFEKEIV